MAYKMEDQRQASSGDVQVGLLLPSRDLTALRGSPRELVDMACAAEALGYDSVWLGESVVARPRFDPMVTLAAIAARTDRIGLGTAVLVATLRHPVHLAHAAACLDQLSDGRVILGVGAGPSYGPTRKEYAALAVPFDRRFERLCEAVDLCRALWKEESVTFDGTFYHVTDVAIGPKPVQIDGPAVWLGAKGPRGRRLAGERFDGWFPGPQSPQWFATGLAEVRDRAVSEARPLTGAVYVTVTICTDTESGRQSARAAIERYYGRPYEAVANLHDSYLGSASGAAVWLNRYAQSGADHIVVRLLGTEFGDQMRRLAEHLPVIRGHAVGCNPDHC